MSATTASLCVLLTSQQHLPAGTMLGESQKIVGSIFASSPCWLATCRDSTVHLYDKETVLTFAPPITEKTRGEKINEQVRGSGVVSEQLIHEGQVMNFFYPDSVAVRPLKGLPFWGMAPLQAGERYLVWNSKFNGRNSDGTFLDPGLTQQSLFKLPFTPGDLNLRLARCRLRTVATEVPNNDADLMKVVAKGLRFGGADARDSANFLCNISGIKPNFVRFVTSEFPGYVMTERNSYSDPATRAFCSYLAYYLGGSKFQLVWLDDLSMLKFTDQKLVNASCLAFLDQKRLDSLGNGFGTFNNYDMSRAVEPDQSSLARFNRARDNNVRYTLLQYIAPPQTESIKLEWIKILVKTNTEEWAANLAEKVSDWVKNPNLSPGTGQTMDSVRHKLREAYGID